jgi:HK97 family phage major capsid protein
LLNQSPTDGGAIADDLDALALAIMDIEAANGRAVVIVASPSAWASLTTLKTGTGSNASLVGADVESVARQSLGIEVIVSAAITANQVLVLDRSAVLSARGNIQLATSTDAFFASDSMGIRVTRRFGQVIVDSDPGGPARGHAA